jgi:hypothetical protein
MIPIIIVGYVVVAWITAIVIVMIEYRNAAREGRREPETGWGWFGLIWPIVLVVLTACGIATLTGLIAKRLARTDRIPEVVQRRNAELERTLRLHEGRSKY